MNQAKDEAMIATLEQSGFTGQQIEALMNVFQTQRPPAKKKKDPPVLGAIKELSGNTTVETSLLEVAEKVQRLWLAAYPEPEWIQTEILKALAWIESNPSRRPQKFGMFMNNWLSKGWEIKRRGAPLGGGRGGSSGLDSSRWKP